MDVLTVLVELGPEEIILLLPDGIEHRSAVSLLMSGVTVCEVLLEEVCAEAGLYFGSAGLEGRV
jgi:hypothetical protein